jgi:NDP-sugar pyrophosphorylase family protein
VTPVRVAVILAGGLGTRLRAVVADRPKVLAEVDGRPFITYLLDQVASAGCHEVVLCTGYLGEQIEAAIGPTYRGLEVTYSREAQPLGTGGALRLAVERLDAPEMLVLNGDSFCAASLAPFAEWHTARGSQASLLLAWVPDASRYGTVVLDASCRIQRFEEKRAANGPGWINAGVYLLKRDLLASLPADAVVSLEREVFPRWCLYGFRVEAPFIDIGVPAEYARALAFFQQLAA